MNLDESKLRILRMLVKPMTVTEISKRVGISKATVSHHLKDLQKMGLVKVVSTEVERNFIRKYFVSTISTPDFIRPQEKEILEDFKPTREEFIRMLLRLINVMHSDNGLLLKKAGFDVGYHIVAERIDDDVSDGLAEFWEKMKLGRVVESSKSKFVVEDCYNCSGLPAVGRSYCKIDEGIIEGVIRRRTGDYAAVREIKCWGTGDRICEFEIRRI